MIMIFFWILATIQLTLAAMAVLILAIFGLLWSFGMLVMGLSKLRLLLKRTCATLFLKAGRC
jgi:hypothetical protein